MHLKAMDNDKLNFGIHVEYACKRASMMIKVSFIYLDDDHGVIE